LVIDAIGLTTEDPAPTHPFFYPFHGHNFGVHHFHDEYFTATRFHRLRNIPKRVAYLPPSAVRPFASIRVHSRSAFASLADVAKGGDGAKAALREIFPSGFASAARVDNREIGRQ
jgi:hypothetical protein